MLCCFFRHWRPFKTNGVFLIRVGSAPPLTWRLLSHLCTSVAELLGGGCGLLWGLCAVSLNVVCPLDARTYALSVYVKEDADDVPSQLPDCFYISPVDANLPASLRFDQCTHLANFAFYLET